MALASTAKSRVAYIAETAWATIPTTPTFLELRHTNGQLTTKKTVVESGDIHLDRRTRAIYQTGQDVSGSYDVEFSAQTLDSFLAGVLQGAWTSNVLNDGNSQQSFTFEETVDIGGGAFTYNRFQGCEINSMTLNLASRAAVKGTINIMGQQETMASTIVTGATYTASNSNVVETAATISNLSLFGLGTTPSIKNLSLTIDNSMRIRDYVGSLYTLEFGSDVCKITGSIDAYFADNSLYALSLSHSSGTVSFEIGTVSGKRYTISIPTAQIMDGARKLGGRNEDVMVTIPFEAIGDASNPLITVTRAI